MKRFLQLFILLGLVLAGLWSVRTYQQIQHVLTYRPLVKEVLAETGSPVEQDLILAMIYTETKGQETDLLQASESLTGEVGTITDERESLQQGIGFLASQMDQAQQLGLDSWSAVQAYNFGSGYLDFVAQHGRQHTLDLSRRYSREVVAPSLGNETGLTYPYYHPVALYYGETSLYHNGGNSYYAQVVAFHQVLIGLVERLESRT